MSGENMILNDPKTWVANILSELTEGLYERDDTVAMALLTVLSGQSVFLYGPPGTAKSMIARRISCVFEDASYFEYLMQRFSTPEDVFGPVSISELKKDNYLRKTENYLPTADIAFLDEIWKSSPAILNTLLTIINERKFKNGSRLEDAPLKALIAASNEIPAANGGLDALYDRFITRLIVDPMRKKDSFEMMISNNNVSGTVSVSNRVSSSEWQAIISTANDVLLSSEVLSAINDIRERLRVYNETEGVEPIYISDRRWQKAVFVMKTAALLSDRNATVPADVLVLKSCLWSAPENKPVIDGFVEDAVSRYSTGGDSRFDLWKNSFEALEKEVRSNVKPVSKNFKEPEVINGIGCFPLQRSDGPNGLSFTVFVPFGPKKAGENYIAYGSETATGRREYGFKVRSVNDTDAVIEFANSPRTYTVPLDPNSCARVPKNVISTYRRSAVGHASELSDQISEMKSVIDIRVQEFDSPFVPENDLVRIFDTLNGKVSEMESYIPRCKDLTQYLDDYAA